MAHMGIIGIYCENFTTHINVLSGLLIIKVLGTYVDYGVSCF